MEELQAQLRRNPLKNKDGDFAVLQFPNWQFWGVIITNVLQRVVPDGRLLTMLAAAQTIFIIFWAYEELVRGDSLFRRILGLCILATTFWSLHTLYA